VDTPDRDKGVPLAIIVMGVSGTGKSTLGALLARTLACPFLEGDDFHDPAAVEKMRNGQPLDDADRWPWLDRLGSALGEAAAANGRAVAACSALRRCYRDRLIAAAGGRVRFVLLDNDREELLRRLSDRPGHYMPPSLLDSQLDTLERPGPDEPVLTLGSRQTPADLCTAALAWLESSPSDASTIGHPCHREREG
jgi:gluconokinase